MPEWYMHLTAGKQIKNKTRMVLHRKEVQKYG